jgi:hypothetical protein
LAGCPKIAALWTLNSLQVGQRSPASIGANN